MKYYVNADDFGWTSELNAAMDIGIRNGWLQSVSLMMNTEGTEEAIRLAEEHGYKDRVGFHLNLTSGRPLTEKICDTALCKTAADGKVFRQARAQSIQYRCMSRKAILAIRTECEAQMKRFRENGFKSCHIDSHRWCLCNIPVWIAIRPLLNKYGFTTVRSMDGHFLNSSSGIWKLYFRFVQVLTEKKLTTRGEWSGCGGELIEAVDGGELRDDVFAELYTHPKMLNNIPTDLMFNYNHDHRPLEEVAQIAAQYGEKKDVV